MAQVLIVEDETVLARSIVSFLERRGFSAAYAVDAASGKVMFDRETPRLVILDYKLQHENGLDLLAWMRARNPDVNVVMMTGHGDVEIAVKAMKAGARDFLVKPAPLDMIVSLARDLMLDEASAGAAKFGADRLAGRSSVATELRRAIRKLASVAATPPFPPVMISGPAGVGKSLVGLALHETARETDATMVEMDFNLAGADQVGDLEGVLAAPDGATILLKHIDAMNAEAQARLLAHLIAAESGGPAHWILTTTTRNLAQQQRAGLFSEDLLYRIQLGWIEVNPLRDRPADILPISENIAHRISRRYQLRRLRFTPEARAKLLEHDWPGNVRELANCIERAALNSIDSVIEADGIRLIGASNAGETEIPNLQKIEEQALEKALEVTSGNVSRAAKLLGITRDTMRYRMEKFGLSRR